MTDDLRTMLAERADALPAPQVDLDAIEADGRRRVRRRRAAALAGVVAAVVAITTAATLVPLHRDAAGPATASRDSVVYAVGSTLHVDGRTVDLGHPVTAMVQTATGVVFTSGQAVYAWDGDRTRIVGWLTETADSGGKVLFVDDAGTHVVFLSKIDGRPTMVAVPAGSTLPAMGPVLRADSQVRAVDGNTVYVAVADTLRVYRFRAAFWTRLRTYADVPHDSLVDVSGPRFLHQDPLTTGAAGSILSATPTGEGIGFERAADGRLSPDGAHLFSESADDTVSVFDTATGRRDDLRHPGMDWAAGTGWIDDDTFWAVGIRDERVDLADYSVLRCSLISRSCSTVVRDAGPVGRFVAPNGYAMGAAG